jgi:Uma2 family endonuclease
MGTGAVVHPHLGPYTVDDLFELPGWDARGEVIDGCLIMSPAASPLHQRVADRLCRLFDDVLPSTAEALTAVAVRLPNGDGPVPDVVVMTGADPLPSRGVPAADVHTVVEVVSPTNAHHDRVRKRDIYAEVGIPCYWRVELQRWGGYRGPLPLVVVRVHEAGRRRTILAPAGRVHALPVAAGRTAAGVPEMLLMRLDPAVLAASRSA